jgi:hypothetical protein
MTALVRPKKQPTVLSERPEVPRYALTMHECMRVPDRLAYGGGASYLSLQRCSSAVYPDYYV